jgi:hypothetical protein
MASMASTRQLVSVRVHRLVRGSRSFPWLRPKASISTHPCHRKHSPSPPSREGNMSSRLTLNATAGRSAMLSTQHHAVPSSQRLTVPQYHNAYSPNVKVTDPAKRDSCPPSCSGITNHSVVAAQVKLLGTSLTTPNTLPLPHRGKATCHLGSPSMPQQAAP